MKRPYWLARPVPIGLFVLGLIVVAVAVFFLIPRTSDKVYPLKLSTGKRIEPPKRITTLFLERAKVFGLNIALEDVEGTDNSLDAVNRRELDIAVVKGGIRLKDRDNVRQVTALDIESFHLLVKEEDVAGAIKDLGSLRGKRININKPSTGTHHWALDILKFAGLEPNTAARQDGFIPTMLGNQELTHSLDRLQKAEGPERQRLISELPHAIVFADHVPSPIVRRLVVLAGYRVVPLTFGPAYVQERGAAEMHEVLDSPAYIEVVTIADFSYSVSPPVPDRPCASVGVRRLLIAHKDVPAEAIVRCLRLLYDGPANPALDFQDWAKVRPEYKLHDGVAAYVNERQHVLQNTIIKLLERLASVLGGMGGCILAIYGYFRYRRLLRFEHYFHEIRRIEHIARGKEVDPAAPKERRDLLRYLQDRMADLRSGAIAEFAQGRLQGESLILTILMLIHDTSNYLTTLKEDT